MTEAHLYLTIILMTALQIGTWILLAFLVVRVQDAPRQPDIPPTPSFVFPEFPTGWYGTTTTTITIDGKKIDPESPEGKAILERAEKLKADADRMTKDATEIGNIARKAPPK